MMRFIGHGAAVQLFKIPIPEFFIRKFLVGKDASNELVRQCRRVIQTANPETLAARFRSVLQVNVSQELLNGAVPMLYLCAKADKIVSRKILMRSKLCAPISKWH